MRIQFSLLVILFCGSLFAQPLNDDCLGAINISSIDNYCSQDMEFTNLDATTDVGLPGGGLQDCNHTNINGVWFTFVPLQPDLNIQILSGTPEGTIFDIEPTVYTGNCQSGLEFVNCAPGSNEDFEWLVTGLTLGQRYYLLVSSNDNGGFEGSFKLCINDFIAPPAPEADCDNAVILCDNSTFSVLNLSDVGDDPTEMTGDCIVGAGQQQEQASAWYIWTCDIAGSLTFTITPSNPTNQREDLDFVLYEFPGGIEDCENRISTRCMLSGETDDGDPNNDSPCFGATGLMEGESDFNEFAGCTPPSNNFLAPLQMVSGVTYGLIVNNFSESGFGFNIEFGGTGTFLGPDPDFDPEITGNVIECERIVEYTDRSNSDTDPIVNWAWNFGLDADPQIAVSTNPMEVFEVVYESFGIKSVALTVESSRGCFVTKIVEVDVQPCCRDTSTLGLTLDNEDIVCPGDNDGVIFVNPTGGAPDFQYSINGGEFLPSPLFQSLGPGDFEITIQDIKGCEVTDTVTIIEPDPISIDAGLGIEVDLGFQDTLNAIANPPNPLYTYMWDPIEGLDCIDSDTIDCPNPIVIPPGTTTYTVTITDENGCTATDQVTVEANIVRPIYAPNVVSPNAPNRDNIFRLGFGRQADFVQEFIIFDRWGGQIYRGTDIQLDENNEMESGWDGRFGTLGGSTSGNFVNPGVYAWFVRVLFIDNVSLSFAGDVTMIR